MKNLNFFLILIPSICLIIYELETKNNFTITKIEPDTVLVKQSDTIFYDTIPSNYINVGLPFCPNFNQGFFIQNEYELKNIIKNNRFCFQRPDSLFFESKNYDFDKYSLIGYYFMTGGFQKDNTKLLIYEIVQQKKIILYFSIPASGNLKILRHHIAWYLTPKYPDDYKFEIIVDQGKKGKYRIPVNFENCIIENGKVSFLDNIEGCKYQYNEYKIINYNYSKKN